MPRFWQEKLMDISVSSKKKALVHKCAKDTYEPTIFPELLRNYIKINNEWCLAN